tara:strand:- start:6480 stop:9239 length:2760 start_codon:yes stop_codon:yes gene_type:complete
MPKTPKKGHNREQKKQKQKEKEKKEKERKKQADNLKKIEKKQKLIALLNSKIIGKGEKTNIETGESIEIDIADGFGCKYKKLHYSEALDVTVVCGDILLENTDNISSMELENTDNLLSELETKLNDGSSVDDYITTTLNYIEHEIINVINSNSKKSYAEKTQNRVHLMSIIQHILRDPRKYNDKASVNQFRQGFDTKLKEYLGEEDDPENPNNPNKILKLKGAASINALFRTIYELTNGGNDISPLTQEQVRNKVSSYIVFGSDEAGNVQLDIKSVFDKIKNELKPSDTDFGIDIGCKDKVLHYLKNIPEITEENINTLVNIHGASKLNVMLIRSKLALPDKRELVPIELSGEGVRIMEELYGKTQDNPGKFTEHISRFNKAMLEEYKNNPSTMGSYNTTSSKYFVHDITSGSKIQSNKFVPVYELASGERKKIYISPDELIDVMNDRKQLIDKSTSYYGGIIGSSHENKGSKSDIMGHIWPGNPIQVQDIPYENLQNSVERQKSIKKILIDIKSVIPSEECLSNLFKRDYFSDEDGELIHLCLYLCLGRTGVDFLNTIKPNAFSYELFKKHLEIIEISVANTIAQYHLQYSTDIETIVETTFPYGEYKSSVDKLPISQNNVSRENHLQSELSGITGSGKLFKLPKKDYHNNFVLRRLLLEIDKKELKHLVTELSQIYTQIDALDKSQASNALNVSQLEQLYENKVNEFANNATDPALRRIGNELTRTLSESSSSHLEKVRTIATLLSPDLPDFDPRERLLRNLLLKQQNAAGGVIIDYDLFIFKRDNQDKLTNEDLESLHDVTKYLLDVRLELLYIEKEKCESEYKKYIDEAELAYIKYSALYEHNKDNLCNLAKIIYEKHMINLKEDLNTLCNPEPIIDEGDEIDIVTGPNETYQNSTLYHVCDEKLLRSASIASTN